MERLDKRYSEQYRQQQLALFLKEREQKAKQAEAGSAQGQSAHNVQDGSPKR